jgi:ribosomal protein S18 acetylase RimI-like enzyme
VVVTNVEIRRLSDAEIDARINEIVAVYAAANEEDIAEGPTRLQNETLPRHRARDGFRFFAALDLDDADALVGMVYGYIGARGQWWTDRVAAAMSAEQRARWIDVAHYEVVELAVRPDRQRHGIGQRLLQAILADVHSLPFALLSTDEVNTPARALYAKLGWREILDNVDLSSPRGPFVILARELR